MNAKDFTIGAFFKNKMTGRIIKVIKDNNGIIWFEDITYGDLFLDVDENLYEEIYRDKYIFSKDKWDTELRKLHNGENPFAEKCKWVDICDGLEVEKMNSTMGVIDIGKNYDFIEVALSCCIKIE